MQFVTLNFINAKLLRLKLGLTVKEIRIRARSTINRTQMKIPKGRKTMKHVNKGQRKISNYFSVLHLWPELFPRWPKEEKNSRFIMFSLKQGDHKRLRWADVHSQNSNEPSQKLDSLPSVGGGDSQTLKLMSQKCYI